MTNNRPIFVRVIADVAGADQADLISLADAAKMVPGRRGHVQIQVLQRYANPLRGRPVRRYRVVLPTITRCNKRWTTRAAVAAWLAECDRLESEQVDVGRTPRQATLDHQRAVRNLKRLGLKIEDGA